MSNWIDDAISYLSPATAAKRARARYLEQVYRRASSRSFDGADRTRRTKGWRTSPTSANSENGPALVILRDRSRDLVRNNPYAAKAVQAISTNVVGTGIIAKPMAKSKANTKDLGWAWKRWAESTECDADGLNNFYGLQNLVMRTMVDSGEVLVRRRRRFSTDKLTVPLQIQVLEPDYIDTLKNESLNGGGFILQGVEFDALGKRVAYWLFPEHPGDAGLAGRGLSFVSQRVPAEDLIHLFRVDRAGQVRGIVWGAPSILRLRDFDEYEDAQLVRQKIAACFAGFVQDVEAPVDAAAAQETVGEKIEPGAMEVLPPGKTITFPNPPQVSGYREFTDVSLHGVASGYGVTYEILTGDYSRVNFSSGRMGWIEFHRNVEQWRWLLLIPRFCEPAFRWFCEAAFLMGYKGTADSFAQWTPPAREMIDPSKEVSASISAMRAGIKTIPGVIREQGYDPDELVEEMIEFNKKIDAAGLILDSDARKTMKAGIAQTYVAAEIEAKTKVNDGGSEDAENE